MNVFDDPAEPVELGASIFVEVNRNLVSAAKEFGLSTQTIGDSRPNEALERLGIWNGRSFVYTQSEGDSFWWGIAKLIWNYGMSPIRTKSLVSETVGNFVKMYDPPYFPFRSLSATAKELGLTEATSAIGRHFLEDHQVYAPFSTDIIQASTRVNYAQNLDQIHGLEAIVCMSTDGAMAIKGGNWQIFDSMIKASSANLLLNTSVSEIFQQDDGTYIITSASANESDETTDIQLEEFDTVVLAAPLQFSNVKFDPLPSNVPEKISYVQLHVTLFSSPHKLSPLAFNLPSDTPAPEVILTTLPNDAETDSRNAAPLDFFSVSTLRSVFNPAVPRTEYLYKVFSPEPLTSTFLSRLLGFTDPGSVLSDIPKSDISWVFEKVWHSYPYLPPRVTFDEIQLDANLWYTSGIESFISTMETSSLMGTNVARLIVDDWMNPEKQEVQDEL